MKRERDPTPEEFAKFLAWLTSAGRDYETLHLRLIRIFISRGCLDAETLADEVMNRVAVRIDKVVKTYGDPAGCLQGFAEKVHLEDKADRRKLSEDESTLLTLPDDKQEQERQREREEEDDCLTKCMGELTLTESTLFQRYFQEEKPAKINARKKLAAELRLTVNALRIKSHRIRQELRRCMETCLNERRAQ